MHRLKNYLKRMLNLIRIKIDLRKIKPKNDFLIIFDIDDTLCENPLHQNKEIKEELINIYKRLRFNENIFYNLKKRYLKHDLIFLSARNPRYKRITHKWLEGNLPQNKFNLFLCGHAKNKLAYLSDLKDKYMRIIYVDDLSYFVDGQRCFYKDIIQYCENEEKIEYLGWSFISKYR